MATATKRKRAEEPEQEALESAAGDAVPTGEQGPGGDQAPPPPSSEWADETDLPTKAFVDVVLPSLSKKVRVRLMTNTEAASMALLPDMARFTELMGQMALKQAADENAQVTVREAAEVEAERYKYMRRVAHTHVVDRSQPFVPQPCEECTTEWGYEYEHVPSMWTMEQTGFLDFPDLTTITRTAERAEELNAVAPLSEDPTPADSSPPANTGDETPPTS